jgi:hypothetical protein
MNLLGSATFACCLVLAGGTAEAKGWEWELAPYLWGSSVELDVEVDDEPALGGSASFSDLVDKLEGALQIHFEGRRNKMGFLVDFMYISLGDNQTLGPGNPAGLPPGSTVDTEVDQVIVEGAGFYRLLGRDADGLDLLFGVRGIEIDQEYDFFDPLGGPIDTVASSPSFTDGLLGLRYLGSFGKKWGYDVRADYGGGDTEGGINLLAGLKYGFGKTGKYSLAFGARHMDIEVEETESGSTTETEIGMSGPFVAFVIRFGGR